MWIPSWNQFSSITKRYGDATRQARDAIARGVDLVVGSRGDGTRHELANAVIGTGTLRGKRIRRGLPDGVEERVDEAARRLLSE